MNNIIGLEDGNKRDVNDSLINLRLGTAFCGGGGAVN